MVPGRRTSNCNGSSEMETEKASSRRPMSLEQSPRGKATGEGAGEITGEGAGEVTGVEGRLYRAW